MRKDTPAKVLSPKITKLDRNYRHDWQFAYDMSKKPIFKMAAFVIFLMPVALKLEWLVGISDNFIAVWASSVCYFVAVAFLNWGCPLFIKEYRDFGTYLRRNHTYRWIVWEFYNTFKNSKQVWKDILEETNKKGISVLSDSLPSPNISNEVITNSSNIFPVKVGQYYAYRPVAIGTDIYLPVNNNGALEVIFLKEDDLYIEDKEKELFWILYTFAVKSHPLQRSVFWIFIYLSFTLFTIPTLINIYKVLRELPFKLF